MANEFQGVVSGRYRGFVTIKLPNRMLAVASHDLCQRHPGGVPDRATVSGILEPAVGGSETRDVASITRVEPRQSLLDRLAEGFSAMPGRGYPFPY